MGAPAGEWRFGSLELQGWGFSVRIPIAAKGALFDAPGAVGATGSEGMADFDVLFGYTGSYRAGPHGVVASVPTEGAIGQDPDQEFPSGDDAPGPDGGVDWHEIPIEGGAFLRIALEIPGPDDIDLFLIDPTGLQVASSTNGGTDELIDVALPMDGTYRLAVHGWSVPSAPLRTPSTPGWCRWPKAPARS